MRKLIVAFLLLFALASPALSQEVKRCSNLDTQTTWTSTFALLGQCTTTTGPAGTISVVVAGEAACSSSGQIIQVFIGSGASPINGSNFFGQVSAGVLSINSMVPGTFPAFTIQPNQQYLTGGTGVNFAPTLITGQIDGITGGLGRYNIANNSLSEPANTDLYALMPFPVGATAITPAMSQNGCNPGFIVTALPGVFTGAPNTQYWVGVAMSSGAMSQTSQFNNTQWSISTQ